MRKEEQAYNKIILTYKDLSKQQKKLADFIITKHEAVIGLSLKEISRLSGSSEPTIIKFSRQLGFKGYGELKANLLKNYKQNLVSDDNFDTDLEQLKQRSPFVQEIIDSELRSLKEVLLTLDEDVLDKCAKKILEAENVYIYSGYTTKHILLYLGTILSKYGFNVVKINEAGRYLFWKLSNVTKKDFVIMYKFHKPTKDFNSLLGFLKDNDLDNLVITNSKSPAIVSGASNYLYARRANTGYFYSMIIPMILTEMLLKKVIKLGGPSLEAKVKTYKNLRDKYSG